MELHPSLQGMRADQAAWTPDPNSPDAMLVQPPPVVAPQAAVGDVGVGLDGIVPVISIQLGSLLPEPSNELDGRNASPEKKSIHKHTHGKPKAPSHLIAGL